jgi:hypothetical protein
MTTKADNDNKQEAATSQLPSTTADVESTNSTIKQQEQQADGTKSETDSDIVDELAQGVGKIHVSEVDEVVTDDSDEPEEMPEALRKVASWIMDGTVKKILVLTGAGVRYVCMRVVVLS